MKHLFIAALVSVFAIGSAMAQEPTCESKAVGKDGKPLTGAAKTSFIKKCKTEACEPKALGSDGKKLTVNSRYRADRTAGSRPQRRYRFL